MKIVRFSADGKMRYGVQDNDVIKSYQGSPFENMNEFKPDGNNYNRERVKLLAPCQPSKIVALGLNYQSHVAEFGKPKPKVPLIFLKPSTSVIDPEEFVVLPTKSVEGRVDFEGEAGVVIGKTAQRVSKEKALDYVLGYTCVNDVSARTPQSEDGQWTRAKGFDTFAPIGPCIDTEADPSNIKLETRVNGQLRQSFNTKDLIFNIPHLIWFISDIMTLLPGDIISTGTGEGVGPMSSGDVVEISIPGCTLTHYVKNQE